MKCCYNIPGPMIDVRRRPGLFLSHQFRILVVTKKKITNSYFHSGRSVLVLKYLLSEISSIKVKFHFILYPLVIHWCARCARHVGRAERNKR